MKLLHLLFIHILLLHLFFHSTFGFDSLYSGQSISGSQKLTSRNERFELGFFPEDCYYCCIAIWYKKLSVQTIVWMSNYENSVSPSSELVLSPNGDLLINSTDPVYSLMIYSSKSTSDFNSTRVVLEDSGNLVVRSISHPSNILWQSFDHPTDTWLPGAKIGFNKLTQKRQVYRSLSGFTDEQLHVQPGSFSLEMDTKKKKSIILKRDGIMYGTCRVKGFSLSCSLELDWYTGKADMVFSDQTQISYASTTNETYFTYSLTDSSVLTRFVVSDSSGLFTQLVWSEDSQAWIPSVLRLSNTYCDKFALYNHKRDYHKCAPAIESATFLAESISGSNARWSPFQCHGGYREGFLLIPNTTISLTAQTSQQKSMEDCKATCLVDCKCTAYAYSSVCMTWDENLFAFQNSSGDDVYVRLAIINTRKGKSKINLAKVGIVTGGISLGVTFMMILIWKCRKVLSASQAMEGSLTLMKHSEVRSATKNFSSKLGEGGFGTVYKGTLRNSSDIIAVKRLKVNSQGEKQFRAEVSTLGTIHHVNLVCLKGFCVEGTKRYLVYDYMPNGSLEKYLFGGSPLILDWKTRYQIALGVAKGLAYLHEECRECIIHCDIKPENILLDAGFKPKISDFGLAKLLGRDFSRVLTTMRGTRGYLAPEWISGIAITSKADVYSYGMMLFEIISGRRNWCIRLNGENDYSPLQVMEKLTSDGDVMSLLDSKLEGNANVEELMRVCRVAGWCIQDDEKNRLSMVQIVQILEGVSEAVTPPVPRFLQYIAEIPEDSQNDQ